MQKTERRTFVLNGLELRSEGEDQIKKIVGHAAVFDELSQDLGGFREKIAPGAFSETINKDDIRALWNHDPNFVLGRNKSGTLALYEDEQGLAIEITPPDTQAARDLMVSMERGDVTQMSFGFKTIEDTWNNENGEEIRTLVKVDIFDVSPVTYPAYTQTDVALRSLGDWKKSNSSDESANDDYKLKIKLAQL